MLIIYNDEMNLGLFAYLYGNILKSFPDVCIHSPHQNRKLKSVALAVFANNQIAF